MQLNRSIMAIGAHADDIELQAGGTCAKYVALGYRLVYVMSTNNQSGDWFELKPDGSISAYIEKPPLEVIMPQRKKEAADAARYYGTEPIHLNYAQKHYRLPDGTREVINYGSLRHACMEPGLPSILTAQENEQAIDRVAKLILEHAPEAIITHGGQMANVEHFTTMLLVAHACKKARESGYTGMLLSWHDLGVTLLEIMGSAYTHYDSFIDISDFWEQKIHASALHACQKPDPRRLDWPNNGPACGVKHAEVFTILATNPDPQPQHEFTQEILKHLR